MTEREQGRTRRKNADGPLLFMLLDNGDRQQRGPIVYATRDRILVPKWKKVIVRSWVRQWPAAYYRKLLWVFDVKLERG